MTHRQTAQRGTVPYGAFELASGWGSHRAGPGCAILHCHLRRKARVRLRQARLKTKFWYIYPAIQTGIWHGAAELVGLALRNHRGRPSIASLTGRPLPDEHFDFRAGDPPRRRGEIDARTRCHDRAGLTEDQSSLATPPR